MMFTYRPYAVTSIFISTVLGATKDEEWSIDVSDTCRQERTRCD